nr:MAG TPA: hypothetical protein [Caudoviricetes sp.]
MNREQEKEARQAVQGIRAIPANWRRYLRRVPDDG